MKKCTKSSEFTGVHWHVRKKKWVASITVDHRKTEIGRFSDEREAAKSYDRIAFKYGRKTNILQFKRVS